MEPPSTSPPLDDQRAALEGDLGDEEQFRAMLERGKQIIDQAFRLRHVMPAGNSVRLDGTIISRP
jgi:hypothetical protein